MIEQLVIDILLAGACIYLARHFWKKIQKSRKDGCDASSCACAAKKLTPKK